MIIRRKQNVIKQKVNKTKCFSLLKNIFFKVSTFLTSINSLICISVSNKECKVRPEIVNVNSNEPAFYTFSIKTNKCSVSCNNINDPYAKKCVSDAAKDLNIKVLILISRTNKTRHIKWHETCKCKGRLDSSVCNNKQR